MLAWNLLDFISGTSWFYFCKPLSWMTGDFHDFLFAQRVGLNSPDFIFAFWGSVAWVPLISFYFSGVQPHLGAPQGDFYGASSNCSSAVGPSWSLNKKRKGWKPQFPCTLYNQHPKVAASHPTMTLALAGHLRRGTCYTIFCPNYAIWIWPRFPSLTLLPWPKQPLKWPSQASTAAETATMERRILTIEPKENEKRK